MAAPPDSKNSRSRKPREQSSARDCGRDAGAQAGHYYTLREELWLGVATKTDFLCLDCLEVRLGKPLTEDMFVALPSEIVARFAGENPQPKSPAERQRDLEFWRDWIRERGGLA